ncbi:MAG: tetratricopeptide repeat protein, partial [Candidatus Aerophobus sp.]
MKCIKRDYCLMILLLVLLLSGCAGVTAVKETDPTILQLQEAIKQNPNDPKKRMELAQANLGKYIKRRQHRYLDRSIEEAREAVRLKPELADAHGLLSSVLMLKAIKSFDKELIDESKREYKEALRINPEWEKFDPPHLVAAAAYFAKSLKEKNKEYVDRAIKEVKEVIRLNPNYAPAHKMLGAIYYSQAKNELALLELKEAVRLNPSDPWARRGLAEVYSDQEKYDLALSELKEVVRLAPDDPNAHKSLGRIYTNKVHSGPENWDDEAIEKGIKAFKKIIRLTPEDAYAHRKLSYLYEHKGLYDLQIFEAKEALRLKKSAQNHRTLGSAYENKGDYDRALKEHHEALRLEPDYQYAHANVAYVYFLQNRFKDAVRTFKKHTKLADSPGTYPILDYYLSLKSLGKDIEAQEILKDYVRDFKGEAWELHLLGFHQGNLSESELVSKAKNKCERCEAHCYVGYQYLLKGDK